MGDRGRGTVVDRKSKCISGELVFLKMSYNWKRESVKLDDVSAEHILTHFFLSTSLLD